MRIINVPVRGIGKTTTDLLADLAVERETSMWGAIDIVVKEQRLPGRTLRGLEAFHKLITDFVGAAQELSTAELLERIVNSSKYVEMLQEEGTEESESRNENIRELLTAAVESGERGESLSAGERQLVALLRAGVADPDVLVLDEATSSVDALTEVRISHALTRLAEGRTTLAIAHRLSTAARADRVLVLDAGRLVEDGHHDELVAAGGTYSRLYDAWLSATSTV
jgi:energy-coupling factor transporter ATP-binding protein EcfA2